MVSEKVFVENGSLKKETHPTGEVLLLREVCAKHAQTVSLVSNGSGVPIAISPYLRLEPPYCSSLQIKIFGDSPSSEKENQKNKNKFFCRTKIKTKKQNQFFQKRRSNNSAIGYNAKDTVRAALNRNSATKHNAHKIRETVWSILALSPVSEIPSVRVGA